MRALLLMLALAACKTSTDTTDATDTTGATDDTPTGPTGPTSQTADTTGDTGQKTKGEVDLTVLAVPPVSDANTGHVATSRVCSTCHTNPKGTEALRDEKGRGIAPFDLWQGSMMANSARDPLWRAMVGAEAAAVPTAAQAIEQKCMRCHAPMASVEAAIDGASAPTLSAMDGSDKELTALATDGVSCTACHQIEPTGFGSEASFSGGFDIAGEGRAYGPHAKPRTTPMSPMTGFTPTESDHVSESELCATCHTLRTQSLDLDGTPNGEEVLEQAPYLEWLTGGHDEQGTSCQDCHLPKVSEDGVPLETTIAHAPLGHDFPGLALRSPVGRHTLVGGNTLIPQVLDGNRDLLQPLATSEAFEATLAAVRDQLGNRTAALTLVDLQQTGDEVSFAVQIDNLAGHKFPTGIPLRRAWLHTAVRDSAKAVVFESGAWDDAGRLVDAKGTVLPSEEVGGPVVDHVTAVSSPSTVPVYEAVLADKTGAPTWRLLAGAGYAKDNRLLPTGWSASEAAKYGVEPAGVTDADFAAGSDLVQYTVDVTGQTGPFAVEVELRFQPLSARAAAELFATGAAEARALEVLVQGVDQTELVATAAGSTP